MKSKIKSIIKSIIYSILSAALVAFGLLIANFFYFSSTKKMIFGRYISGGEYEAIRGYGLIKEKVYGMGLNSGYHGSVSIIYEDIIITFLIALVFFLIIFSIAAYLKGRKKLI